MVIKCVLLFYIVHLCHLIYGSDFKFEYTLNWRAQYQKRDHASWLPKTEDNNGYQRNRLIYDVHLSHKSGQTLAVQFITAHVAGKHPHPAGRDLDALDFQKLYLELFSSNKKIGLRLGRQSIKYGRERMIATLNGPNSKPVFDGLKFSYNFNQWKIDLFKMYRVVVSKGAFDNETDKDWSLSGLHLQRENESSKSFNELYFIALKSHGLTTNYHWEMIDEFTFGSRYEKKLDIFKLDVEVAYQWSPHLLRSHAVMSELAYIFSNGELSFHVQYYSGDSNPHDNTRRTFRVPNPKGANFGELGLLAPSNIILLQPKLRLSLPFDMQLKSGIFFAFKAEPQDAIYNYSGKPLLKKPTEGHDLGQQVDFELLKKWNENLRCSLIYSHLFLSENIHEVSSKQKNLFQLSIHADW